MPTAPMTKTAPGISSVPFIALGDSLTQGFQSMGVAAISQNYSYPKQIADFLGITTFAQPVIRGSWPASEQKGQSTAATFTGVGNPPNLELVLRRAEALLAGQPNVRPPSPTVWRELHDEAGAVSAVLREALTDYLRTIEDAEPASLLAAPAPRNGFYQNLGVFGFTTLDISSANYAQRSGGLRLSFRGNVARIARQAIEGVSDLVESVTNAHPSLLQSLTAGLLTFAQHDFGARIAAESVGYVLGWGSRTALEAARAQQPRFITLWIGNSDVLTTMCDARIWDGATPLYTPAEVFADRITALVEQLLAFDSRPYLFLATLPSPTASPNLVRNRLGHWKSMLPSAAFLVDDQLLELEGIISDYNAILRELAQKYSGRVWLVDIHTLQERMQRATRDDAETTRSVIRHAVRAGLLSRQNAGDVLDAARGGNLATLRHIQEVNARLGERSFTTPATLTPDQSGAYLAHRQLSKLPSDPNVDAFIVRLASGKTYRLTGEYLAAGDNGAIMQGGVVGLDAIHLTNTGYAYVAREFLRVMFEADHETNGAVLRGLPGQGKAVADFDADLLRVAQQDSLLNSIPRLLPAALDAAGAVADLLGELHYSDPYLNR